MKTIDQTLHPPNPASSIPVLSLPSGRIARLRLLVLGTVILAFSIEVYSRSGALAPTASRFASLIALVLLCATALWLIFMIDGHRLLKGMILVATSALLLAQCLTIARQVNLTWPTALLNWERSKDLESLLLLMGIVLMLTTYYFALIENVIVAAALTLERRELYKEIGERKQAQAALNRSRNRLRRLTAHVENVREEERSKVAREMHDELGQALTSLKIDLANLKRQIAVTPGDTEGHIGFISEMSTQVDSTMREVRRIAAELRPSILDDLGLHAATEWLAKDFEKRTGIPCDTQITMPSAELDGVRINALFRTVQEALTNVVRHARATRVKLRIASNNGHVSLDVADDGVGMQTSPSSQRQRTFGILGIQERAAQLGGEVHITSTEGSGTRISVVIPIADSQSADSATDGELDWQT